MKVIPSNAKTRESDYLWRYIDIHKLINFLTTKSISFSRMDLFSDNLEGASFNLIENQMYLDKSADPIHDFNLNLPNPIRNKRQGILDKEKEKMKSYQMQTYVSCWYVSSRESTAMWDLYSNSGSVAMRIKPEALIKSILNGIDYKQKNNLKATKFVYGNVRYKDIIGFNPIFQFLSKFKEGKENKITVRHRALRKDVSYQHEKEYRFFFETQNNSEKVMSIPLDNIGAIEIVFHPKMQIWQKENVNNLLNKFNIAINTRESEISRWMR